MSQAQPPERDGHLVRLSRTIRRVNKLIAGERDAARLVREVCRLLHETPGYCSVVLVVTDAAGKTRDYAEAGIGEPFAALAEGLRRGFLPPCFVEAMRGGGAPVLVNRERNCPACALSEVWPNADALCVLLRHGDRLLGYLAVAVERGLGGDAEEVGLLEELAGDVALGLSGIEERAGRHAAERALAESEALFQVAFDESFIGRALTAPDGRLLRVNRRLCEMLGYTVDELASRSFGDITHPDDLAGSRECVRCLLAGESTTYRLEKRYLRKDGSFVWTDVSTTLLRDRQGRPVHFITDIQDCRHRKQAEGALRHSEHRFRTTLYGIGDAVIATDERGRVEVMNAMAEALTGWRESEALGRELSEVFVIVNEQTRDKVGSPVDRVLSEGRLVGLANHTILVARDGTERPIADSGAPLHDEDGALSGVVLIFRDQSKERAAEARLREERDRAERIFEVAGVMMVVLDSGARVVRINRRGCELLGYEAEDILGRSWFEQFIPARNRPGVGQLFSRLLDGSLALDEYAENPVLTRNGEERLIAWHNALIRDDRGAVVGTLSSGEDITERRRLEAAEREGEAKYRALFEHMAAACCVDEVLYEGGRPIDYRILDINPSYERITGISRERAVGALASVVYGMAEAPFLDTYARVAETGQPASFESFFAPIGKHLQVTVSSPAKGRFSTVFSDCTERIESESALKVERDNLQATMSSAPVALLVLDDQERITRVNPAAERLFGRQHPERLRCGDFLGCKNRHDDPRGCGTTAHCATCPIFGAIREALQGNSVAEREMELELETPLGVERRWFIANAEPLNLDGRRHAITALHDTTERGRALDELKRNEARLRSLVEIAQNPAKDVQGVLDFTLNEAIALTGSKLGYIYHYHEADRVFVLNSWSKDVMKDCLVAEQQTIYELDKTGFWGEAVRQRRPIVDNDFHAASPLEKGYPEGHVALRRFMTIPIFDGGTIVAVVGVANKEQDYTDSDLMQLTLLMGSAWKVIARLRAEAALKESEARARALYDRLPIPTFVWERRDGSFYLEDFNEKALEITRGGIRPWVGRSVEELYPDQPEFLADMRRVVEEKAPFSREMRYRYRTTDAVRDLRVTYCYVPPNRVMVHTEDVTEQRRTEEHLRLAQKMEAVGQLAGGVAHDFNNLLSVILSYTGFAADALREGDPLRGDLEEVRKAAGQAAALTRQLLAFSRKQVLDPEVISLTEVAAELEKMLRRVIGEDIDFVQILAPDLGLVKADPGQLEQVLMNLVVNARDALLPAGGRITIETANVVLDDESAARQGAVASGPYVMLAVSDNGCGMDEATRLKIFEPFFTTKGKGKGTGLGLSTVYGIVRQSGGNISVYSEPGLGTTFKVYLPRVSAEPGTAVAIPHLGPAVGTETILIVEDEDVVRKLVARILATAGYEILTAAQGDEALRACENYPGRIHLLLTDVVMPQMSGRQLAERLTSIRPGVRVLYMSGYTDDAILHHGVLMAGTSFIGKPFTAGDLARKVRETLDAPSPDKEPVARTDSPPGNPT